MSKVAMCRPHAFDLLLVDDDLSAHLCGSLSLRDLASLRSSCTAAARSHAYGHC
jgi:hypothetical protein